MNFGMGFATSKVNSFCRRFRLKYPIKLNGFTLIEVLIAIVILSIALLALGGLMVTSTRNNSLGSHLTEASTLAQDMLERLRAQPYWNWNDSEDNPPPGPSGIAYHREWVSVKDSFKADTTITITWSDPLPHNISFKYTIRNE
jgi:prepilin-type N-terminal cleavage/methylation domain-containing protein